MLFVASEILCLRKHNVEHCDLNKAHVEILALNNSIFNNPRSLFLVPCSFLFLSLHQNLSQLTVPATLTALVVQDSRLGPLLKRLFASCVCFQSVDLKLCVFLPTLHFHEQEIIFGNGSTRIYDRNYCSKSWGQWTGSAAYDRIDAR